MSSFPIYIITGLSGAGKSQAIQAFEDMGFYCVDNLPSEMVHDFIRHCQQGERDPKGVALVIDVREGDFVEEFPALLEELKSLDPELTVLFLEASSEVLLNRYKESRRPHPLGKELSLEQAIEEERNKLKSVRQKADHVVDTSRTTIHQFRGLLKELHHPDSSNIFTVTLTSFGFKHGIPAYVDTLFDARFLPNPHYESELKDLTGIDREVKKFFESKTPASEYLDRLKGLLDLMIEEYTDEGKSLLSVGIGCTGGRHRSVHLVDELSRYYDGKKETRSVVTHRDLDSAREEDVAEEVAER